MKRPVDDLSGSLLTYPAAVRKLATLFLKLARNDAFARAYPECASMREKLESELLHGDDEPIEFETVRFYSMLHRADVSYSPDELSELEAGRGYGCHASGLSPIYHAIRYITPDTRAADFGAGNGLQTMLLQYLRPHRRSTAIEISGAMIDKGRRLAGWMGIPEDRLEWIHNDIANVSPARFDFIYMYLPVRPEGKGESFYRSLARALSRVAHPITLLSVADRFRPFAPRSVRIVYEDGHVTCYSNTGP